ncbi:MAG: hypothetical protein M1832_004578 [Thelocarpon impressellum]|nr:MAG: hypothetical protein M1832_004578 [Thelocarpon impressellum]
MSTSVWPPLPREQLLREEEASTVIPESEPSDLRLTAQARELEWLLDSLQDTLASLRAGLEECVALLAPREPGSTLVLSSSRSDSLKGFVTRVGTRIVRGDMHLKMHGLPVSKGFTSYRLTLAPSDAANTLVLGQLVEVRNLLDRSLDVVDVSTWTGDAKDASFISGQLRLLSENIQEARLALRGTESLGRPASPSATGWADNPVDPSLFEPALPENLSFYLSVSEAALHLQLRTLESPDAPAASLTGFDFRSRLAVAIGAGPRTPAHDEADAVVAYRGESVRVRDRVRVESQDPSLMAMMAKLAALEHNVALARRTLDVVMGKEET